MRYLAYIIGSSLLTLGLLACEGREAYDIYDPVSLSDFAGDVIVSTQAGSPSSGPGLVALFSSTGNFKSLLVDFYQNSEYVTGHGFLTPTSLLLAVEGADRVESYDLLSGIRTPFTTSTALNASPIRQLTVSSADGSVYVVEANQRAVEKFTAEGSRVGNPFIPTTVGSCSLNNPWGIAYISKNENIAVISNSGGRLSIYDKDGNCVAHYAAAPFNSGGPAGIAYHEATDKLLVTFETSDAVYAFDADGTNGQIVFQNSSFIDGPRAITVDSEGYVYVGSNNTDTIEKLEFDGTTATRALGYPLMGPSIYTQNPTAITVVPR